MPADDVALLRQWFNQLLPGALDPADDRYVPLEEATRASLQNIFAFIDLPFGTTTTAQLLSGPNGSGKTTELYRLKRDLEGVGFRVVLVDMLAYVSQSAAIDATEFLIAVGLAFGEEMLGDADEERTRGFAARFREFLRRVKVSVDAGPVKAEASAQGVSASALGLSVDIDLKTELRGSQPFVQELRDKLAFQLGELYEEVAAFCQELVAADKAQRPDSRGVVLIVDSLEKLRESKSVQQLFLRDSDKLRFASHHVVYTAPPYLLFTDPGALPYDGPVQPVSVPHVRDRTGDPDKDTMAIMREVVARRVDWRALLGDRDVLDQVILASGGHLRDLFRLLQAIIAAAHGRNAGLPVGADHVGRAVNSIARDFAGITEENAACLRQVMDRGGTVQPATAEIDRLARLLDTHMLLAHVNDDTWYEVHPLARRALGSG